MQLPRFGSKNPNDETTIVAYVDGFLQEAAVRRIPHEIQADSNLSMYTGNQWQTAAPGNMERLVVQRTQDSIIAVVAIQTEQKPKVSLTPRESMDEPIYFVNTVALKSTPPTEELSRLLSLVPPECVQGGVDPASGQPIPPAPLPEDVAQTIQLAIQQASLLASQAGLPSPIPDNILVPVNDRVAAEATQTVFDALWDRCDADYYVSENLLNSNIIGWQFMLYEWDDKEQNHVLSNPNFLQVHIDPLASDISRAQYVIYDQIMSADEAVAMYPQLEASIREMATEGVLRPAGYNYRLPYVYQHLNFRRSMIIVRTAWLRNAAFPMTEEEALATGKLVREEVTEVIEEPKPEIDPIELGEGLVNPEAAGGVLGGGEPVPELGQESVDESPQEQAGEASIDRGDSVDVPEPEAGGVPAEAGSEVPAVAEVIEPVRTATRVVYRLPDGQETSPDADNWPTRPGIRQIRIIVNKVVDDRECEFWDIPLCHNVNVPLPYSPFGQGEPQRLEGLQKALNAIISDVVNMYDNHSAPSVMLPQSVNDRMPAWAREMYTAPYGTKAVVPDDLWQLFGGKLSTYIDPPSVPTDAYQIIELLLRLMDETSGHTEVLQGKASASWSGEAIGALQKAAKGTIGFKSRRTERVLKRLVRLMVTNIIHRMTAEDWARYVGKYPVHVLYALQDHAKSVDIDISIEITSGSGISRTSEQQMAMMARREGLISRASAQEKLNFDPQVEDAQMAKEARQDAAIQAQAAPQPQMPPPAQQQAPAMA
jgi:hypothetical protein